MRLLLTRRRPRSIVRGVKPVYLAPAERLLTRRNCAEGVAASIDFAVLEQGSPPPQLRSEIGEGEQLLGTKAVPSGTQVGYLCLYMPPLGASEDVLCCFDVVRVSERIFGPWISQGDVVRDAATGALILSRLSVSPLRDEIPRARQSTLSAGAPASSPPGQHSQEDAEAAAYSRMADASEASVPRVAVSVAAGGVTSGVLRDVPIGWVHLALGEVRKIRGNVLEMAMRETSPGEPWFGHAVADAAAVPRRRPGRPALSDEHLRHVAELVLQDSGMPNRGSVHRRVGEKLNLLPPTVRDHIAAARRAGWLAPTSAGRRDAAPGPRLRAAWEEES